MNDWLEQKEGDKKIEEKLGVKLMNRYNTIQYFDTDYVTIEPPAKDKTYTEKKKELDEQEKKVQEETL